MQIKWLDDLLAIAELKSFSRAAESRCITQSALSKRVKSLEDWAGVELVDRGIFPIQLTKAGTILCKEGRELIDGFLKLRSELRDSERMPGRSVQIAAGHSISATFLPKCLVDLKRTGFTANTRVTASNVTSATFALQEGACDVMICYYHPLAPIELDPKLFNTLVLGHDEFVPLCAPDAEGNPSFPLPGNLERPVPHLAYTASTFFSHINNLVLSTQKKTLALDRCYEGDMAMLLQRMAVEGYGVAWLPKSAAASEINAKRLVSAGPVSWSLQLEIRAYCSATNEDPVIKELWNRLGSFGCRSKN